MTEFSYGEVTERLRAAYGPAGAARREVTVKEPWKLAERAAFLRRLTGEGVGRLLEIGAGTGQDSVYFQEHGLDVVATDLSESMVERCRAKGVDARVMDFLHLDFPAGSFDAVYALNCLLHVPNADLPAVLAVIRSLLRPGGLVFVGAFGGESREWIHDSDLHDPPRFFAARTDGELQAYARAAGFDVVDFHPVDLPADNRFQSLTLRRPGSPAR